jgi:hypothetical protein
MSPLMPLLFLASGNTLPEEGSLPLMGSPDAPPEQRAGFIIEPLSRRGFDLAGDASLYCSSECQGHSMTCTILRLFGSTNTVWSFTTV